MYKVLVSTFPFCQYDQKPSDLLKAHAQIQFDINPYNRKMTESELAEMIGSYDALIAGTEPITAKVMSQALKLKIISRVGVGLDSVDLKQARLRNINVTYTAEAPAPAVAELTLGLLLALARKISEANQAMHQQKWNRFFGERIGESVIGIIGCGRIGSRVIKHLSGFSPKKILCYDTASINPPTGVEMTSLQNLLQQSDFVTLHVPLTAQTRNMITLKEIRQMKSTGYLINTSRGGIINENDLATALNQKLIQGAAIDVFEQEPYFGELSKTTNCLLTSHMGSMSYDCRNRMELEATENVVHFLTTGKLLQPVPESEYELEKN